MNMKTMAIQALTCAMTLLSYSLFTSTASAAESSLYMGAAIPIKVW